MASLFHRLRLLGPKGKTCYYQLLGPDITNQLRSLCWGLLCARWRCQRGMNSGSVAGYFEIQRVPRASYGPQDAVGQSQHSRTCLAQRPTTRKCATLPVRLRLGSAPSPHVKPAYLEGPCTMGPSGRPVADLSRLDESPRPELLRSNLPSYDACAPLV